MLAGVKPEKMEHFGIKAEYFSLYEAIKKEAEKVGWKYNTAFVEFHEVKTAYCDSLYFNPNWDRQGDFKFSLSNCGEIEIYKLPEQWDGALAAIRQRFEQSAHQQPEPVPVSLKEIAEWKGVPIEQIQVTA